MVVVVVLAIIYYAVAVDESALIARSGGLVWAEQKAYRSLSSAAVKRSRRHILLGLLQW
jgi:hypothetical protein